MFCPLEQRLFQASDSRCGDAVEGGGRQRRGVEVFDCATRWSVGSRFVLVSRHLWIGAVPVFFEIRFAIAVAV